MTVTVDFVKKLILDYIGGKPIFLNKTKVFIDGRRVVIEKVPGLGSITDLLSNFTSVTDALQGLVQNPLGTVLSEAGGFADDLVAQLDDLGLPGGQLTTLTDAFSGLQTAMDSLQDHTDGLLGIAGTIPDTLMSVGQLMQVDDSQVQNLAGSLFSGDTVSAISSSLNSSVSGGISALVAQLADTEDTELLVNTIAGELTAATYQLEALVASDEANQTEYHLAREITHGVGSIMPPSTGGAHKQLFDLIATDALREIQISVEEDDEDADNEDDDDELETTRATQNNVVYNQSAHTHTVDDIVGLLAFVVANAPAPTGLIRPISFFFTFTPTSSEPLLLWTSCETLTIPDDFAGSVGDVETNPTSSFVMDVLKNGVSIGSITISTSGEITFVTSGSSVSIVAGDKIKVVAPSSTDATVANVSITMKALIE